MMRIVGTTALFTTRLGSVFVIHLVALAISASLSAVSGSTGICDFNLLAALKADNLFKQIHDCIQIKLLNDVTAALNSATDFKDQVGISCLGPGLEIIKAAQTIPAIAAIPATDTTPAVAAVPEIDPGPVLLFQKFRQFELAGGPAACKTWVNSTIAGANPLTQ